MSNDDCRYIPLGQGLVAIVDETDYARVCAQRWHIVQEKRAVEAVRCIKLPDGSAGVQRMQNFLWGVGIICHVNGNGLDNRRANMSFVDPKTKRKVNKQRTKRAGGSSKYRGVYWNTTKNIWTASLKLNGRTKYLGCDNDEMEAALLYVWAVKEIFGDEADARWDGFPN